METLRPFRSTDPDVLTPGLSLSLSLRVQIGTFFWRNTGLLPLRSPTGVGRGNTGDPGRARHRRDDGTLPLYLVHTRTSHTPTLRVTFVVYSTSEKHFFVTVETSEG